MELLSHGLSGGKVERALQILRSQQFFYQQKFCKMYMYIQDRDTGCAFLEFLSDNWIPTGKIDHINVDLLRRLRESECLFANTFAEKVASDMKNDQCPFNSTMDLIMNTSIAFVSTESNNRRSQNLATNRQFCFIMIERRKARARSKKYSCGNREKPPGKWSRKQPAIRCNVDGWVHFNCSRLAVVIKYVRERENLCSKCSRTGCMLPASLTIAYSKLGKINTSCQNSASFGNRSSPQKESTSPSKKLTIYYGKVRHTQNLNQLARTSEYWKFRINEVWSIDVADMQRL